MQNQSQNNMITPIDKIPLKTSNANITDDMSDDPIVKDVLNEFEKELSINEQTANNYKINVNLWNKSTTFYVNVNTINSKSL